MNRWDAKRTMIVKRPDPLGPRARPRFRFGPQSDLRDPLALSAVSTFFVPAQTIMIRAVTPREGLMAANALMQQAFQVVRIISPAIAGAMVNWIGAKPAYYFDSASFILSAAMIAAIAVQRATAATESSAPSESGRLKSILNDLIAGVRFIFTHATISFVMLAMSRGDVRAQLLRAVDCDLRQRHAEEHSNSSSA